MCRSRAKPSLVWVPVLKFPFRVPLGAPLPLAPPCIRHVRRPRTAGPRQRSPLRLDRAEHLRAAFSREVSYRIVELVLSIYQGEHFRRPEDASYCYTPESYGE
jgi:hypothetical protein